MLNAQVLTPINQIHDFLNLEIVQINAHIASCFQNHKGLLSEVAIHFISSKGKKIRPILTALCAKMLGACNQSALKLAASIELIHIATLLHDDVIDDGKVRRGLPTANVIWGNEASILSGDFFFSQAFKLMVESGSLQSMEVLSKAFAEIVEGEIKQLAGLQNKTIISEEDYFEIIEYKTAKLFSAACEVAAIIKDCFDNTTRGNLKEFGKLFGLIYQVKDDMLDYFGNDTGKQKGADFNEGKITLPIILLYKKASSLEVEFITKIFADKKARTQGSFEQIILLLDKYKISSDIVALMQELLNKAKTSLNYIEDSSVAKSLITQLSQDTCLS